MRLLWATIAAIFDAGLHVTGIDLTVVQVLTREEYLNSTQPALLAELTPSGPKPNAPPGFDGTLSSCCGAPTEQKGTCNYCTSCGGKRWMLIKAMPNGVPRLRIATRLHISGLLRLSIMTNFKSKLSESDHLFRANADAPKTMDPVFALIYRPIAAHEFRVGFLNAVKKLGGQLQAVTINDTMEYFGVLLPTLMAHRHYVELALKDLIDFGREVVAGRSATHYTKIEPALNQLFDTHNLSRLWEWWLPLAMIAFDDPHFRQRNRQMARLVGQLHDWDLNGERFRYARDKTGELIPLSDFPIVDLKEWLRVALTMSDELESWISQLTWDLYHIEIHHKRDKDTHPL